MITPCRRRSDGVPQRLTLHRRQEVLIAGIDVGLLLQQRPSAPDAEAVVAAAVVEAATSEPWKIEPLPSEQWPRFLVRFAPQQEDAGRREYEMLVSEGFDARYDEQKEIEVIASAVNLIALLHRGYQLNVIRDLLSGEDAGGH